MAEGRTIAIGDIHGCDVALAGILEAVAPRPEDHIVLLGDVCDRGPNTRGVIDALIELGRHCDVMPILGNHDEMMLAVFGRLPNGNLNFWWRVGGAETLESYGGDPNEIPDSHLDFLDGAAPYLESPTDIFVHARLHCSVPLSEQTDDTLRWDKIAGTEPPHPSGRRVICGHTAQHSGRPRVWDGWVCLDTQVYSPHGWLTALDVHENVIYQANQAGEQRDRAVL